MTTQVWAKRALGMGQETYVQLLGSYPETLGVMPPAEKKGWSTARVREAQMFLRE